MSNQALSRTNGKSCREIERHFNKKTRWKGKTK